ncbi:adenylate/guanylate cyclase domain-containing protein [Paenibacillus sp. LHD-117]|uniref:HAMP domain-containing protein n=1 Tax=Paenibacillus sp. LHD-117 TaxID=3071412 RepID=UPI0027E14821|nr:adenylate/guanylate cyclase domain-containing protein [Paenibacillus sp. LHD-117]MDQ6423026.1 adenylate/guanylate cyclase domain-containing protein [Paenibacillus sp. LHD-117]
MQSKAMVFMRKSPIILLLLALAVGLGWLVSANRTHLESMPFERDRPLTYLSKTSIGPNGLVHAIADSRKELIQLGADNVLRQDVKLGEEEGGSHGFTEVAAADDGSMIALDTVLDEYGLYVQEERLMRYAQGDIDGLLLYAHEGSGSNKRIGQIKGVQSAGDYVYFYVDEAEAGIGLFRVPLTGGEAEGMLRFALPEDRYLSEVAGYEKGEIYYSTRRGAIYHVTAEGESEKIYPLPESERTSRNFPEVLQLHEGRLYFIDRLVNAVSSISVSNPADIRTELTEDELSERSGGAEYLELMDLAIDRQGGMQLALDDRIVTVPPDKQSSRVTSALAYGKSEFRQGWIAWSAALLLAVVLAAMLRMIYVHWLNRRVSLFFKQVFAIVPILVVSMILLSNFIYDSFSGRMEEEMQRQLSLLARNGQSIIDGDQLSRLNSPSDYGNADYEALRAKMGFLYENEEPSVRQGLYSTLYKYENGEFFVIMDDDDGVNMFKPFALSETNKPVVDSGAIVSDRWEDATGKWLYAIGPVYDSAGKVVGVYETGSDLNVLYKSNQTIYQNILRNIGLISLVIIALVLGVTYWLLRSLRKLRRSVMEMASGNWDVRVNIRSQDEVGDLGEQFNRMAQHIRTYIKDITTFSEASHRFVPQQFFKYLGKKGITEVHLGDQVQGNMSVMVANIRSFNQLSKQLSPKQNFDFMNGFLKRFSPFVRQEEGLVSKYLGAGFMALFPGRAEDAIRAAIAIRRELAAYNDSLIAAGYRPVDMGMAIHKGPLMLGIVGEDQRMEGNVISDDVNVTTALERLSDTMGASVLVTKSFFDQLRAPERIRHRYLGRVGMEGKDESVELIDVYEGDTDKERQLKDRTKAMFEKGIRLCQEGRFFDARETFIEVIKVNRFDKAAKLYFYLCDEYYQKGSSEGWNGTLAV